MSDASDITKSWILLANHTAHQLQVSLHLFSRRVVLNTSYMLRPEAGIFARNTTYGASKGLLCPCCNQRRGGIGQGTATLGSLGPKNVSARPFHITIFVSDADRLDYPCRNSCDNNWLWGQLQLWTAFTSLSARSKHVVGFCLHSNVLFQDAPALQRAVLQTSQYEAEGQ